MVGVRAGEQYVDTGTLHGYRSALRLLENTAAPGGEPPVAAEVRFPLDPLQDSPQDSLQDRLPY